MSKLVKQLRKLKEDVDAVLGNGHHHEDDEETLEICLSNIDKIINGVQSLEDHLAERLERDV